MTEAHEPAITDPIPGDLAPGVHRLRSREPTSAVSDLLERAGWSVCVVDLAEAPDKAAIMDAFVVGLGLPAWFGRNWDALTDALRDLGWLPAGRRGRVLLIRGAGRTDTGTDADRTMLADVLRTAADSWVGTATPLVVLLRR
jgi:hypothetical protein